MTRKFSRRDAQTNASSIAVVNLIQNLIEELARELDTHVFEKGNTVGLAEAPVWLGKCMEIYQGLYATAAPSTQRKIAVQLQRRAREAGLQRAPDLHIVAVMVLLVFGVLEENIDKYFITLKAAIKRGVFAMDLDAWIAEKGGVHQIYQDRLLKNRMKLARYEKHTSTI